MRKIQLSLIILSLIIFASCSNKIYYSSDLNSKVAAKGLSVNKIQFYISKKVILDRVLPHDKSEVEHGAIRFENGKYIDQVIINKNTPGTCEFFDNGFMFVSFEEGHNKLLKFIPSGNGEYYELYVNTDPKNYRKLTYDTAVYRISPGAEKARLWIRKDQDYILKINQRVAEGKTVNTNY